MRKLLALLAVLGLAACNAAETGSNEEACGEAAAVVVQINEYREAGPLTSEQENTARQWEFRLAEAAVVATDHDLSDQIRDLADAAGNVAADMDDEDAMIMLDSIYGSVTEKCN